VAKKLTGKDILKIKMVDNDAGAKTIREYLVSLIYQLWVEGEGFSGKRPFGNSGWEYELYNSLAAADAIKVTYFPLEEDEVTLEIEDMDTKAADKLIKLAIASMQ
jgi:hypothetical protein